MAVECIYQFVTVHEALKLENRIWEFGYQAFALLTNAFNFGPCFSAIALHILEFDSDKTIL